MPLHPHRWEEDEEEDAVAREARLMEEARQADQREKEEFEDRLRARDEERTKKLSVDKLSKDQQVGPV